MYTCIKDNAYICIQNGMQNTNIKRLCMYECVRRCINNNTK